jgi:hypothetical protein
MDVPSFLTASSSEEFRPSALTIPGGHVLGKSVWTYPALFYLAG